MATDQLTADLIRENAQLKSSVRELEENLEKYAWSYSPAMAEAKIDQLNKEVEQLKHDYEQLKELYDAKIASVPIGPIVGAQTIVNQEMEINKLKAELAQCQQDLKDAAGELAVPIPEAGTDMARLLSANVLLRQREARLRKEIEAAIERCDHECSQAYIADHLEKALEEAGT